MLSLVQPHVVLKSFEPGIWETFVIVTPGNAFVLEQIDDCGDIAIDEDEAVAVQSKCVATCRRNVVWLTRSTNSVQVRQQNSLINQGLTIGWITCQPILQT